MQNQRIHELDGMIMVMIKEMEGMEEVDGVEGEICGWFRGYIYELKALDEPHKDEGRGGGGET